MKTSHLLALLTCTLPLAADEAPLAEGHSVHGEAFNEGPRQAAYLMKGLAPTPFAITTTNEQAQAFFNQGISQLHGFWYFEAERSFRQVLALDPTCPMAYWGMSMANVENAERAAKLILQTKEIKTEITEREKQWIVCLTEYYQDLKKDGKQRRKELIKNLEQLVHENPEDLEAKAFLVYQIWTNQGRGGIEVGSTEAVDALIQQVLDQQAMHPIHHYKIHLWDGKKTERALPSAARCGQASPGIAHMWHMPGHIYSKLHRYPDAAWQQEASSRVDHAQMMRDRVMPHQIHNYAHNNEWLARNLTYFGRVHDAIDLAKNLIELPRKPRFNTDGTWSPQGSSINLGTRRLAQDLVAFECWEEILSLESHGYFDPLGKDEAKGQRHYLLGLAAFETRQFTEGQAHIRGLKGLKKVLQKKRVDQVDAAEAQARKEKEKNDEIDQVIKQTLATARKPIDQVDNRIAELELVRDLQDETRDDLAARVKDLKDISKTRRAQLAFCVGDYDEAEKLAADAAKAKNQVGPLANYVDILYRLGKRNEAIEQMEALRKQSSFIDLDLPVMDRLAYLVRELGWPKDWRMPFVPAEDTGERPDIASLGPFRWHPSQAPDWQMPDPENQPVKLADYRGKPLVLIFYLGSGCRHCIEQLDAFAPMAEAYRAAGLPILAVSTEAPDDLYKTVEKLQADEIPFPILSDASKKYFKAYRAYDDFEDMALHGTFLIDGDGLIRWQDISFQPFMKPAFLLEEAQRLLAIPVDGKAVLGAR
ncbi:MAG: peroxiredoxin [Verrucomicrobiales bacterium]|jgi:peroxiredoxin